MQKITTIHMQNCDIPEIRKVHRLNPIGKNDKYGIRLYRDEEILLLGMNDLADRWGLLLPILPQIHRNITDEIQEKYPS